MQSTDIIARSPDSPRKYVTVKINVNTLTGDFLSGRRKIAEKIATSNPQHPGYGHVRFMIETFKVRARGKEHLCIAYDVLREPIDTCMSKWKERRFNGAKLRILLKALLQGLDYMHSQCGVVHTDLKPDNIMMGLGEPAVLERFVQREMDTPSARKAPDNHGRIIYQSCSDFGAAPTDEIIRSAKITDLGLAEWGDEENNKPIQSNAFTAPEVLLTAGWSYPADIWNLGVMLWDLTETLGLFDCIDTSPGKYSSAQHLGVMIAMLGPPPKELLDRGATTSTYFDENDQFRCPKYILKDHSLEGSVTSMKGEEKRVYLDFIKKMVAWLPEDRWTAAQLLDHPFLTQASFDCTETEAEIQDSLNLVEQFAVSKSRSQMPTPVNGTPYRTPLNGTPVITPRASPDPSIKAFNLQNRAHTFAHSPIEGPTSAPMMATSAPMSLTPTRSHTSKPSNTASQDLIDQILSKNKSRG